MVTGHPIEQLYDRLTSTFENTSEVANIRLSSYNQAQLSRNIRIETGGFGPPYSDNQRNEIVLNKRFLTLCWCIVYIVMEVAGEKMEQAIKLGENYSVLDSSDPELAELDLLFDFAMSLKSDERADNWPSGLPDPTDSAYKIMVANAIFIDAMSYIMYHEVAHIVSGHWDNYREISAKIREEKQLTEDDKILTVQMEQEADSYAFDCLVASQDEKDIIYHKQLGIIMAGICSMFALRSGSKLTSLTHPSVHVRIFNSRQKISLDEGDEFRLARVLNVGLSMFCRLQGIVYEDRPFATFDDLLDYFFGLLDKSSALAN